MLTGWRIISVFLQLNLLKNPDKSILKSMNIFSALFLQTGYYNHIPKKVIYPIINVLFAQVSQEIIFPIIWAILPEVIDNKFRIIEAIEYKVMETWYDKKLHFNDFPARLKIIRKVKRIGDTRVKWEDD